MDIVLLKVVTGPYHPEFRECLYRFGAVGEVVVDSVVGITDRQEGPPDIVTVGSMFNLEIYYAFRQVGADVEDAVLKTDLGENVVTYVMLQEEFKLDHILVKADVAVFKPIAVTGVVGDVELADNLTYADKENKAIHSVAVIDIVMADLMHLL